ncbi:MAG: MFS transporter [Gemmatimonadales bacterium]|nr:MAG: MFS transporter [Gemmatimonadales bacterium]
MGDGPVPLRAGRRALGSPPWPRHRSRSPPKPRHRSPGADSFPPLSLPNPPRRSNAVATDRVALVQAQLDRFLEEASPAAHRLAPDDPLRTGSTLTARAAVALFEDQVTSRAIDVEARRLKATGRSFYTISSAGHEQNAVLGAQLRLTDPCFLHYRAGGFMMARSRQDPEVDPVRDTLLSICARRDDPISQGRHKVWGSRRLWVPPQTSTIASHLPKAVGMAFALGRARRLAHAPAGEAAQLAVPDDALTLDPTRMDLPEDAIAMCSFGDASANHATALTGINSARYALRRGNPMPILFVCEDNGLGISVDTPPRWIRESFGAMRYLRYFDAEGSIDEIWDVVEEAVHLCRTRRLPVFLRLATQRLWGHAGSDIELAYRSMAEIEAGEARDPLLANARRLIEEGAATPGELADIVGSARERVRAAGEEAAGLRSLESADEVMRPLAPWDEKRVRAAAEGGVAMERRRAFWGAELPEEIRNPVKRTMAAHLSAALADEMLRRPEILVFGEDVGRKGGVYYVTAGLQKRFGVGRVVDTLLDETTILGVAQGTALAGLLPVPEIQYLAYIHNALDQLRGEAASLQYFSNDQFRNPMVVRVAGLAYQKGFGGHFHNDHSIGALRDIPGLILACPARGDDAVRMLRGCLAAAAECGRVVVFLEPIALYHEKDLHEEGDGLWLSDHPAPGEALLPGEVAIYRAAALDLATAAAPSEGREGADAARVPDPSDAPGTPSAPDPSDAPNTLHAPQAPHAPRVSHASDAEILLLSYANGLRMSLQAQRILADQGIPVDVMDLRWLNPLPFEALLEAAGGRRAVLVVDECRRTGGGIAEAVIAELAERGADARLASVRAPDSFVPLGPAADHVLIQTADVVEAVERLVTSSGAPRSRP